MSEDINSTVVDSSTVVEAIKTYFHESVARPTTKGVNSSFILGDPPASFVKFDRANNLRREIETMHAYAQGGIPVPRILDWEEYVEPFQSGYIQLEYICQDEKPVSLEAMGAMMRKMHAIHPLHAEPATWDSLITSMNPKAWEMFQEVIHTDIRDYVKEFSPPHSVAVLHLDYSRDNILARNGEIVAVIDPIGGAFDPMLDLAYTSLHQNPRAFKEFLQGYAPEGFSEKRYQTFLQHRLFATAQKLFTVHQKLKDAEARHDGDARMKAVKRWCASIHFLKTKEWS